MARILARLLFCIFLIGPLIIFAQGNNERSNFTLSREFYSSKEGIIDREVFCALQDPDGFMWFGTRSGLCRFDGKNFLFFNTLDGLQTNVVASIRMFNNSQILVQHGVPFIPNSLTSQEDLIDLHSFHIEPLAAPKVIPKQNQWKMANRIGVVSTGLCFDKSIKFESDDLLLSSKDGQLQVLVSRKKGVWYFEKNITMQIVSSSDFFQYERNIIHDFMKDDLGNIWLCDMSGVYKIRLKPKMFKTYFESEVKRNNQIRGIYVSEEDSTIHAKVGFGLKSQRKNTKDVISKINNSNWSILGVNDRLYYGYLNTLHEVDIHSSREISSTTFQSEDEVSMDCMYQKNDSIILIGSLTDVIKFNRFSKQNEFFTYASTQIPRVDHVLRIFSSSKGDIAVAKNGLFLLENNVVVDYFGPYANEKKHVLPVYDILDAHEDKSHCLWLATNGSGLCQWEWDKRNSNENVVFYTTSNGLPSNTLYRIEGDNYRNLWVSSNDGIFKFSLDNHTLKTFSKADGLPSPEFDRASSFKDSNGELYFGTIDGLISFDPVQVLTLSIEKKTPFQLIGLTIYSESSKEEINLLSQWYKEKRITWLPSYSLLKVDFALLDFQKHTNTYAYRIVGITSDWVLINEGSLIIGSLPHGEFQLEIKAQREDGSWNEELLYITINVLKPWYLRSWVIILEFLSVLALLYLLMRWRNKYLKIQNANLEIAILDKTLGLTVALRDKEILLKELHHRVKNNLQIINGLFELQKDQLTDKNVIAVLNEGQSRLSSIALIHENFYGGTNLEVIEFKKFLTDLVTTVSQLFESDHGSIECIVHSDDIRVDINIAIPLGLIINELLTNSYKFIPKNQEVKKIEINLIATSADGNCELVYRDNGLGLPAHINFESSPRLGLRLVKGLADQIKGKMSYQYNEGSVFTIHFNGIKKSRS